MAETTDGGGLRYNTNKTRHDLVPQFAQEEYAKVLTKGAEKYADNNWRRGMKWSTVLASMKRHIKAIECGEDIDKETGCLHSAHVMCNAAFLTEYYKIYPQGDNRQHRYLSLPKIGLDIDDVIADWVGHWVKTHGIPVPESWYFDRHMDEKLNKLDKDFWLSIPVKIKPSDIGFDPHCYITSRSIPKEWTEEWLDKNGFPASPVYSVNYEVSKVEVAKQSGIDIFVDDKFTNFTELNNAGICCYLFDTIHNQKFQVGHKRLYNLKDLVTY